MTETRTAASTPSVTPTELREVPEEVPAPLAGRTNGSRVGAQRDASGWPTLPTGGGWQAWMDYGMRWAGAFGSATAWDDDTWPTSWSSSHTYAPGLLVRAGASVPTADAGAPAARGAASSATTHTRATNLTMHHYRELTPGPRWQALWQATNLNYRAWFRTGANTPTADEGRAAIKQFMPELLPTYLRLVELAGADDEAAALLSLWNPPAFTSGCSQAAMPGQEPTLIRNYDWDPQLFEGVVASTNYSGHRRVIGTSDLLWGLLDGMNSDDDGNGLAISLTLGGRNDVGDGFGIPIVVRYLLETCATVDQATAALTRIPVAQAYNLTLVDTTGAHATVFVAPGQSPIVDELTVATNHRLRVVENAAHARQFGSVERQDALLKALDAAPTVQQLADKFQESPVHTDAYSRGFGTLYTAIYEPAQGRLTYRWADRTWTRTFDDADATFHFQLNELLAA